MPHLPGALRTVSRGRPAGRPAAFPPRGRHAIIGSVKHVRLQYGTDGLDLATDAPDVTVIEPRFVEGLPDETVSFREAVRRPIGARPLRDIVRASDRVAVVIPDITRPMPSDRLFEAHEQGCAAAREVAMVACERPFPIVVTTNGGYPLDQNLYQTVKGMSAAAQIVQDGGYILTAARCTDGFPAHGNFKKLLVEHPTPQAILDTVLAPGFSMFDQWEAQVLAMILVRARTGLYSEIPADDVRQAHMEPVADVGARLAEELQRVGPDAPVAVLPEGPMTIPYLRC
jgi:nickel-dependent lactate racemase